MSESPPPHDSTFLERVWAEREEVIYTSLFGDLGPGVFVLSEELFRDGFGVSEIDPRWLHHGVFRSPPTPQRPSWAFVTSGLSNPWTSDSASPDGPSGLGKELVLETTTGVDWALYRVQHVLAFELLLSAGHYPGRSDLEVYDRLPLRGSIAFGEPSAIEWLVVCPPAEPQRSFGLESGRVDLLTLFGITDAEAAFAREKGGDELLDLLRATTTYPIIDLNRVSLL